MSYDIRLCDSVTGDTLRLDVPHQLRGGTFALGGTTECWLNVTYNYGGILRRVMGADGIRNIYGLSGADSLQMLNRAIDCLGNDASDDYRDATEGNVKRALLQLRALAEMRPDGVWEVD